MINQNGITRSHGYTLLGLDINGEEEERQGKSHGLEKDLQSPICLYILGGERRCRAGHGVMVMERIVMV